MFCESEVRMVKRKKSKTKVVTNCHTCITTAAGRKVPSCRVPSVQCHKLKMPDVLCPCAAEDCINLRKYKTPERALLARIVELRRCLEKYRRIEPGHPFVMDVLKRLTAFRSFVKDAAAKRKSGAVKECLLNENGKKLFMEIAKLEVRMDEFEAEVDLETSEGNEEEAEEEVEEEEEMDEDVETASELSATVDEQSVASSSEDSLEEAELLLKVKAMLNDDDELLVAEHYFHEESQLSLTDGVIHDQDLICTLKEKLKDTKDTIDQLDFLIARNLEAEVKQEE